MANRIIGKTRLPLIAAPMFIVSVPALVIAQCTAGVVGAFPALNARSNAQLDEWLCEIEEALAAWDRANPLRPAAPFALNQIVHKSNDRVDADMASGVAHRVPLVITSMGAREDLNEAVHGYGGIVLHDVINDRFARKAIEKGADGLIAVAAGAGGHGGPLSPFALIQEIRAWFDGPLALSGAIASGDAILAAQALGADFAYVGSPFIATTEAHATAAYKQAVTAARSDDIIYTDRISGVRANYLRSSIVAAGLDPVTLEKVDADPSSFGSGDDRAAKAWRDIWGCGQGIGVVDQVVPVAELVDRWVGQYAAARARIAALPDGDLRSSVPAGAALASAGR